MGVGSGGKGGAVTPLDFQTWYKYSKKRLKSGPPWKRNSAIFRFFLLIFGLFFRCPLPLEDFLPTHLPPPHNNNYNIGLHLYQTYILQQRFYVRNEDPHA